MRHLHFSSSIVFLLLVVFACKKDHVASLAMMDITDTKCKFISASGGNYYAKYGSNGKISEMYNKVYDPFGNYDQLLYEYQYENRLLRRVVRGAVAPSRNNPNGLEAYTEYEYEYGPVGIVSVSYWGPSGKRLITRYEFKYENYDKPTSMVCYQNFLTATSDDIRMTASTAYKYDGNGNLVQEEIKNWGGLNPEDAENSVRRYYYDNSPNSVKLLHATKFDFYSAPAVFSTNNVTNLEYVHEDGTSEIVDATQFDSSHNVTYHYSWDDVKWDCNK